MLNWFKKRRLNKQIKANVATLKALMLELQISEKATAKELADFYSQVELWAKVLAEKTNELDIAMLQLSADDKIELLLHIDKCISNYGANMVNLNDTLIKFLDADNISSDTKISISTFGKNNITKSENTLNTLRNLAKHICICK